MTKVLNLTFASSLTKLCEINSSFDSGLLKVCYPGQNRNNTFLAKADIERCVKTLFNCPVVCHYDRETDSFGGHDMELVRDADGNLRLINQTTPVGVIPESAHWEWREFEEEDGSIHEYLCVEVLLWKRQEAYRKIKEDGVTAHSMEITVKSGEMIDGIYHIHDFEFTAFALIGVEPCFEGSALEVFSKQDFKQQLTEMMQELKESFNLVKTSSEDDNTIPNNYSMEGGEKVLDKKMELVAKYGIDIDSLDFSIDDFSLEELEAKFEDIQTDVKPEGSTDNTSNSADGNVSDTTAIDGDDTADKFALTSNIIEELVRELESVKLQREWGECTRYWYVDCDLEAMEVYCWDTEDWLLYGFTYSTNGDRIVIDYESKKRKKYVIADFDEGEQKSPFAQAFSELEQRLHDNTELEAKYQSASDTIKSMETELGELRQFKTDTENAIQKNKRDELFARFEDLIGDEAFEALRENCTEYDLETLEEKCFAIRGRKGTSAKFSHEPKAPKIRVEKTDMTSATESDTYGGIFEKFGFTKTN